VARLLFVGVCVFHLNLDTVLWPALNSNQVARGLKEKEGERKRCPQGGAVCVFHFSSSDRKSRRRGFISISFRIMYSRAEYKHTCI